MKRHCGEAMKRYAARAMLAAWVSVGVVAAAAPAESVMKAQPQTMLLGVDDAGSPGPVYADAKAEEAFDRIGFDFLSHHLRAWRPLVGDVHKVDAWARRTGHGYILNSEGSFATPGDPAVSDAACFPVASPSPPASTPTNFTPASS